MESCFLFTETLNEQGCLCLTLSTSGTLEQSPIHRSFEEIHNLQKDKKTVIVESALHISILEVELPWLPERKARAAIPYALEDKVAQSVEDLHFCFDKQHYKNNRYQIVAISKERMDFLIETLESHRIDWDVLTLDWFALHKDESCLTNSALLIHSDTFNGALSLPLAKQYQALNAEPTPFIFKDSPLKILKKTDPIEELSYVWLAQRIANGHSMNLAQGSYQRAEKVDWIKNGYQLAGILGAVWLLSILVLNGLSLYLLSKKTKAVDAQISTVYHQFFPDAKQVISPRFRIGQLLGDTSQDQGTLWSTLQELSQSINPKTHIIQKIQYQNKILAVTLSCKDFKALETLENQLKRQNLKVKQTQASKQEQGVVATLELS